MKKLMKDFTIMMLNELKNDIDNGTDIYLDDIHHEIYNTGYAFTNTEQAREKLLEYDVFKAIKKIVNYELDMFGVIFTDMAQPKKIANMLVYILGEEFLFSTDVYSIGGMYVTNEHIDHLMESVEEVFNGL